MRECSWHLSHLLAPVVENKIANAVLSRIWLRCESGFFIFVEQATCLLQKLRRLSPSAFFVFVTCVICLTFSLVYIGVRKSV